MKKSNILPSVVLGAICLVVAILLSVVNMITGPIIADRQNQAANAALLEVLPNGSNFQELEITADYPAIVVKGWKADGGSVFQMEVKGYQSGLIIMCGVDADGKISGVKHIASNETFNAEGELNSAYTAKQDNLDSLEMILSTSASKGAPMTSQAYYDALKAALQSAILASGGSVDTRTPEQILQDDCNAALGTTGLTFTKWFATEVIEGIDKVYVSDGGRVYVIGETFIGIKADGTVVGEVDADASAKAIAADTIIGAGSDTEITDLLTSADFADITKAYKTASGNYVFELVAEGYKSESVHHFGGNLESSYIKIKLSIDAEGKIIDVVTLSQKETSGIGDKCANEEYYEGYKGAGSSDIVISADRSDFDLEDYTMDLIPDDSTDIGVISGATFTTVAYQEAVKLAFSAFEFLTTPEGGND